MNSQHAQPLHASEHAPSHWLQVIGRQVKLRRRRGTFERPVLDLWYLVVAQVTGRQDNKTAKIRNVPWFSHESLEIQTKVLYQTEYVVLAEVNYSQAGSQNSHLSAHCFFQW